MRFLAQRMRRNLSKVLGTRSSWDGGTANQPKVLSCERLENRYLLHGGESHLLLDPDARYFDLQHERVFNFARNPHAVTVADGSWSDPTIWEGGVLPSGRDKIWVQHDVKYDVESFTSYAAISIPAGGTLHFATDQDTRLEVGTLLVLPDGALIVGSQEDPIADHIEAEIVINERKLRLRHDPAQHGTGILVLGGRLETNGRDQSHSFVELSAPSKAGTREIEFAEPVDGWLPGDRIFLPDTTSTSGSFSHAEYAVIESIQDGGSAVTLTAPLQFAHEGVDDFMPHAAHLSGNITIRSEDPDGVRGHILVTERAIVDVHDAVFQDLGRTTVAQIDNTHFGPDGATLHHGENQIGRYSFHMHHVYGTATPTGPYQFKFTDNVIIGGEKWGLAIHDTHFGLVEDNVIVDVQGAGIIFEDGSETANLVQNNFVALLTGSGEGPTSRNGGADPILVGDGTAENPFRTMGDNGHAGTGIWARGSNNAIRNNVVANANNAGLFIWSRSKGDVAVPAFQGANTQTNFNSVDLRSQTPLEISNLEVYASNLGYLFLGAGQRADSPYAMSDSSAWHVSSGIEASYSGRLEFQNVVLFGVHDDAGLTIRFVADISIDGSEITNFRTGVSSFIAGRISNSYFDNRNANIDVRYALNEKSVETPNGTRVPQPFVVENVTFGDQADNNITFHWNAHFRRWYAYPMDLLVYDYDGRPGDDFQVFMPQQSPDYVMEFTGIGDDADQHSRQSPIQGATNQELWDTYRIAANGRLLPDDAFRRDKIDGFVAPIPDDRTPPEILNLHTVQLTSTSVAIRWETEELATTQLEWFDGRLNVNGRRAYGNLVEADTTLTTEHQVVLTGLEAEKNYYFSAYSHDANGNAGGYARFSDRSSLGLVRLTNFNF